MERMGRGVRRYFLGPITRIANLLFHLLGVAFLLRFGWELAGSERLAFHTLGVLVRYATDAFLAPVWLWMAGFPEVPADSFQAVPGIFAMTTWLIRPMVIDRMERLCDRLEGRSAEKLFNPEHKRVTRRKDFIEGDERTVWLQDSDKQDDQNGQPKKSAACAHRLAPIGFDSENRPQVIGRYELLQQLGRGPMGVVYKAYDLQIGRTVVLKVLDTQSLEPQELHLKKQRLFKEARAAGKLVHAGLVSIFDMSEDEQGNPYIVMEHVEGETLERALSPSSSREPLDLKQRLNIALEIAHAVEYAHRRGILHRDLKPANVMLTADHHAKIVDFGIAKLMAVPSLVSEEDDAVPGTPEFVAPELLNGIAAGISSDIFSLGVMFYWIFTGELPFSGRNVTEITYKVAHINPAPVRQINWALPGALDPVLRRCLAKNPGERYSSAGELAAELQALRYGDSALAASQARSVAV